MIEKEVNELRGLLDTMASKEMRCSEVENSKEQELVDLSLWCRKILHVSIKVPLTPKQS